MKAKLYAATTMLLLALMLAFSGAGAEDGPFVFADLALNAADFSPGVRQRLAVTGEGLMLEPGATDGRFTSQVIGAPAPFNALVPTWSAHIPDGATLTLRLRTASSDGSWSDWYLLQLNDDWMMPTDEQMMGQMIAVSAVDGTHRRIQLEATFSRFGDGPSAVLEGVNLTLIDSTRGPTSEDLVSRARSIPEDDQNQLTSGYPKPSVVPRSDWCDHPDCTYSVSELEYEPVTHLIVHHTVSSNSSSDWAATVRAIWAFHTFPPSSSCSSCRGWGDIGYNYLVDMNGVLYEGHMGGDDVVGTHAAGANAGSMALAFIGTFTSSSSGGIAPPAPMLNSAVELFAWKADQKGIDVYDASHLPDLSWGLPHLMGHRDVYGTTQCPGDQAHALLPWLRDQVANKIGFVSVNRYYDELDGGFVKSPTDFWYVPPYGCGFSGHAYYTWSTTVPAYSTNWGEWRPQIDEAGLYRVEVYAPYCKTGEPETSGAEYKVTYNGGSKTVVVDQDDHVGTWMSLGDYDFAAGNSGVIRLTDLTTTDSGRGVWFDAIRLRPIIVVQNLQPNSGHWSKKQNINFNWTISSPGLVSSTRLEVSTDSAFSNKVLSKDFSGPKTAYSHDFGRDYAVLYWRVKLNTSGGYTSVSTVHRLGIDTVPPSSSIEAVYLMNSGQYRLSIHGSDSTSGIAAYNVDYRLQAGTWKPLFEAFQGSIVPFIPPDDQLYEFRSQAIDRAGHVESVDEVADITLQDAIHLAHDIMLPLINHN